MNKADNVIAGPVLEMDPTNHKPLITFDSLGPKPPFTYTFTHQIPWPLFEIFRLE